MKERDVQLMKKKNATPNLVLLTAASHGQNGPTIALPDVMEESRQERPSFQYHTRMEETNVQRMKRCHVVLQVGFESFQVQRENI